MPEEISADVETLAAAYGQYIEVIQDVGLQPGEIPTAAQAQELQQALQSVGTEDVTAASERLSAWTEENCSGLAQIATHRLARTATAHCEAVVLRGSSRGRKSARAGFRPCAEGRGTSGPVRNFSS